MNRPVYYKSFRSRKFQELEKPKRSILDILKIEKNIILDIGFGTGESTIALNTMFPQYSICGIEAYKPGVKNLIANNMYVHYGDALEVIEKINDDAISQIYMLFPDPWQKKKHRKRRLFNDYTFKIIKSIMRKNGFFHFATDNISYALEAKKIIADNTSSAINFSNNRGFRPVTKFEKKGISKKNFIFDLIYIKQ
ncbi:tRNA (guanosine(46)-N7)-methyltransferase TrmB [Gammaproteobacteria bacterium]|nr:tRNA (guanosine(46)-N7)-methyltransferase TrmB [Gammaproteobacteria bacterium]